MNAPSPKPICDTYPSRRGGALTPRDKLLVLRRDIDAAISVNKAHCGDRVTTAILAGLTAQLARYRVRICRTLARGSDFDVAELARMLGPNGHGPGIADLIQRGEYHRNAWARPVEETVRVSRRAA